MHLILAVICLITAAFAQEFIPIGGGSGKTATVRVSQEFGESFTPSIIDPNDPSFQPANIAGNRPNPIPLFPKTQQAGTPHEGPVDFTFIHQHSYKEPFRNDQFIGILHNPIGAARPNVPRTLGRENIYIDPRTIPNSAVLQAEAEKKNKAMLFYGLAAPIQKLHREDEFAPSSMTFQKPWDQWYDRFTEAPVLPRRLSSPLTQTKRPTIVDIPFYAADRGKRQAETSTEESIAATDVTTTTAPATTTILSDAIGSSTAVAALETTTTTAAAVIGTTTGVEAILTTSTTTTTQAPAAASTTATAATTTVASTVATNTTSSSPVSSSTGAPTATTKPLNQIAHDVPKIAASMDVVGLQTSTAQSPTNVTSNTPIPSTGPVIPFRVRNRRPQNSTKPVTVAQKLRSHRTKVPLRSTVIVHNTTHAPTIKHKINSLKLDSAIGAAKNSSRAATTKLPIRNTTVQRPISKTRVSLRRLFNNASTSKAPTSTTTAVPSTSTAIATSTSATTTTTPAPLSTTPRPLNRTSATTAARSKAPFRIFSKRPVAASKLPARTPIQEEHKPSAIESNNIGTLRTEVNRLLSTVIQLQSTVISQQQRIALLENQLRLRRSPGKKPASNRKTSRFIAANGRTVERTTVDVRKERSAKMKGGLSQVNLRQKSSLA